MKTQSPIHACAQALLCLLLAAVAGLPARAQLSVPDGTTLTINGVTTNLGFPGGTLMVGSNGPGTMLVITNGGVVTNAGDGFVGQNPGSSNNSIIVTGPGSLLEDSGTGTNLLIIGDQGSRNTLAVSDGGKVVYDKLIVGDESGENALLIGGSDSLVRIRDAFYLGGFGWGNELRITNGGTLSTRDGYVGNLGVYGGGADSNLAVVSGIGSKWINQDNLYLGYEGSANRLIINNGGYVSNNYAYIGHNAQSSNNSVFLTVAGSTWETRNGLNVGYSGAGNLLSVANGATVVSDNAALGWYGTSSNNLAVVTSPGSYWSNATSLQIGNSGAFNTLVVSNLGTVGSYSGVIGSLFGSDYNLAVVTGAGSKWTNGLDLQIGSGSSFNTLRITSGGLVANQSGYIGTFGGADSNTVLVSGTGSLWSNRSSVLMSTDGNRLLITNNASVRVGDELYIGTGFYGSNNLVHVSGGNSLLAVSNRLVVGESHSGNRLLVTTGAQVTSSGNSAIGFQTGSSDNFAHISGGGSLWSNAGNIQVGFLGSNNQLYVEDGGRVTGTALVLGNLAVAEGNLALVSGTGSELDAEDVVIGELGTANRLFVTAGARLITDRGYVGNLPSAVSNQVIVTGVGSLWSNALIISLGVQGASSQLSVSDNATVISRTLHVGDFDAASSNNLLTVANGTLMVTNTAASGTFILSRGTNLFNGGLIEADRLLMTNTAGRMVFNGGTLITRTATISNGTAFVVGENPGFGPATWDVRSNAVPTTVQYPLIIGWSNNASLLITNGGRLNTGQFFAYTFIYGPGPELYGVGGGGAVGYISGSNLALVSGAGSRWQNNETLLVGGYGASNRLMIDSGGHVVTEDVVIGGGAHCVQQRGVRQRWWVGVDHHKQTRDR